MNDIFKMEFTDLCKIDFSKSRCSRCFTETDCLFVGFCFDVESCMEVEE